MNNFRGYVPSYRQTEESAVFKEEGLFRLWSWLLWNANWKEGQLSTGQILAPGQLVVSHMKIAKVLNVDRSTVSRRLARLQKLGNIETGGAPGGAPAGTLITICNWGTYRIKQTGDAPVDAPVDAPSVHQACTKPAPQAQQSVHIEVEGKKGRREEGNRAAPPKTFPTGFDLPEVQDAWAAWLKLKPTRYKHQESADRALKTYCREFGTAKRLIRGIDLAIAGGWKGLSVEAVSRAEETQSSSRSRLPTAEEDANWNPVDGGLGL